MAFTNPRRARAARTRWWLTDPVGFDDALAREVAALARRAERLGLRPCLRLNGTSDVLRPDLLPMTSRAAREHGVRLYDYTKRAELLGARDGVSRVYSLSEILDPRAALDTARAHSTALSVVFAVARGADLPPRWLGAPVIDGDVHDLRFLDAAPGVVIGLRAKGRARHDATGFVVRGAA